MTYDMSIHQNPDAHAWAKFFMETQKQTDFVIDEELMIGWFANAMMAMHDHLVLKGQPINGDHAQHLLDQGLSADYWSKKNEPKPVAWRTWSSKWQEWEYSTTPFVFVVDAVPLFTKDQL